jgi:DNA-binding transcriptional LysR family regulator
MTGEGDIQMELYQLECFRLICKYGGSYTKASKELMVTQPAVSIAIKKLEDEYNCELINHKSKTFSLTKMGEALLKRADSIHNEVEDIHTELKVISQKQRETIRLALPFTMCPELLSDLATGFIPYHMDISLDLLQRGHEAITEELANRTIDIGVFNKELLSPTLEARDYKQVEFWACFSPDHPFNDSECITPKMLKNETIILSKTANSMTISITKYLAAHHVKPNYSYYHVFPDHTGRLARQGAGVSFAAKYIFNEYCAPLSPPFYVDLSIAWRREDTLTRQKHNLIDFIAGLK